MALLRGVSTWLSSSTSLVLSTSFRQVNRNLRKLGTVRTRVARSSSPNGTFIGFSTKIVLTCGLALAACDTDKCKGDCLDTHPTANEADAAPSTRTSSDQPSTSGHASTSSSDTTDANPVAPQVFSCRNNSDCLATPFPACSLQLRQCVTCTQNDDCDADKSRCAIFASDELNRCVECQAGSDCASGLCRDDVCLVCDPDTNQGCNEGICLATEEQAPQCVQCVGDDDCSAGVCINHECKTCDVRTSAGCDDGTVCLPRSEVEPQHQQVTDASVPEVDAGAMSDPVSVAADGICVECASTRPCADPDLSVCLNNVCVACDPEATGGNGCTPLTPFCLPGSESTAGVDSGSTANRCVECRQSSDCENAQCVDYVCQPCDPATHAGCGDGGVCLARTEDNAQQAIAYECRECSDEKACEGDALCGPDGKCHECLESSDCKKRTEPFCQSDGNCGACSDDDECPSPLHCSAGQCVDCTKDEHCSGSPTGSVCYMLKHSCVECTETNLDACDGNPCQVLPGSPGEFTCLREGDESLPDGGTSTECRRCTGPEDCDSNTDCAVLDDSNLRCVPLASEAAGRTDCEERDVVNSEGTTQTYCVPFGC